MAWSVIPWERHVSVSNEWETLYGNVHHWLRQKQGAKAQFEYAHQSAETFMIVPFLGNDGGPQSITKHGPRTAAYECHGDGTLPDLSAFANTDFFIVPTDLNLTMVHTHEDYGWGGPYFIYIQGLAGTADEEASVVDCFHGRTSTVYSGYRRGVLRERTERQPGMLTRCHICGLDVGEAPWGESGRYPTWSICPCCGCEFGYEDCRASGVVFQRRRWMESGGQWWKPSEKLAGWDFEEQVKHIPTDIPPGIDRDVDGF